MGPQGALCCYLLCILELPMSSVKRGLVPKIAIVPIIPGARRSALLPLRLAKMLHLETAQ